MNNIFILSPYQQLKFFIYLLNDEKLTKKVYLTKSLINILKIFKYLLKIVVL